MFYLITYLKNSIIFSDWTIPLAYSERDSSYLGDDSSKDRCSKIIYKPCWHVDHLYSWDVVLIIFYWYLIIVMIFNLND